MKFQLPECTLEGQPGQYSELLVSELRPTQNAVGMDEVALKANGIKLKKKKKLQEYLYLRPAPVVIGQGGFYLLDHHHLARALWVAAGEKNAADLTKTNARVVVKVTENWQFIKSAKRFWKAMNKSDWVYPFDHGGGGPLNVNRLKKNIQDMCNDPYRSLAWYVRKRFGYFKDGSNPIFAEFMWANFFRTRVGLGEQLWDPDSEMTLDKLLLEELESQERAEAIDYAVALARSQQASHLPGFAGA